MLILKRGYVIFSRKEERDDRGRLIEEEEHQAGSVPWKVYLQYSMAATVWLSVGTVLTYIARQVKFQSVEQFLSYSVIPGIEM